MDEDLKRTNKRLHKTIKKLEITMSQMGYKLDKLNGVITQLVLVTSILQTRTGGIINDKELNEQENKLRSDIKTRKSTFKSN
jgi:hypothetical protein